MSEEIDKKGKERKTNRETETDGEYPPLFGFADMNEGGFAISR